MDPSRPAPYNHLAITHRYLRDYDASAAAAHQAIELAPASPVYHFHLGVTETIRGDENAALSELQAAESLWQQLNATRLAQFAHAYSNLRRADDVSRMIDPLESMDLNGSVGQIEWAAASLAIGDYEEAARRLEAVIDDPVGENFFIFGEIRANQYLDPRLDASPFVELRNQIGLTGL